MRWLVRRRRHEERLHGRQPARARRGAIGADDVAAQQASSTPGRQAVAWLLFTVLATLGVGLPVATYVVMGEEAVAILTRLKIWLVRNTTVVIGGLCAIIGVVLIGDAVLSVLAG